MSEILAARTACACRNTVYNILANGGTMRGWQWCGERAGAAVSRATQARSFTYSPRVIATQAHVYHVRGVTMKLARAHHARTHATSPSLCRHTSLPRRVNHQGGRLRLFTGPTGKMTVCPDDNIA